MTVVAQYAIDWHTFDGGGGPSTGGAYSVSGAANGVYDLRFAIYDALANGNAVGRAVTNAATTVTDGLFTVTLDYGAGVFTGPPRWLEIAVRTNGGASFATLAPRQPLTPSPYAVFAATASNAATAAYFKGAIADSQLSANIPRLNSSAAFSGSVTAGGLNVTGATTLGALSGNLRLSNFDLFLRGAPDPNHGLGWYGSDAAFTSECGQPIAEAKAPSSLRSAGALQNLAAPRGGPGALRRHRDFAYPALQF